MEWRFAQISDVRLGIKLSRLDGDVASTIRDASRQALCDAIRIAHEQQCEAVLIPGDLYTLKGIDPAGQLRFAYERMADYPTLMFIIAPGNTDAFGGNCPYVYLKPPSNVRIFMESEWQSIELDRVTITGRAHQVSEGPLRNPLQDLPRPNPDKLSVLMLRGRLAGADDGRFARNPSENSNNNGREINVERLLATGYTYIALGGMHAKIELQRSNGKAAAAYASTPQIADWEARGPGGFLTGMLTREGADLQFHHTAKYRWMQRDVVLPPPYIEQYQARLAEALESMGEDLAPDFLYKLKVSGELHRDLNSQLERTIEELRSQVFFLDEDILEVLLFDGVNPAQLPADSLLTAYLQRCSAEASQSGSDHEVYELARRLGWLLFTGKGLPVEISE
ncbi:hypothetical protein JW859_08550 [bacterium]|nr:hypothetical protein [bacterium]